MSGYFGWPDFTLLSCATNSHFIAQYCHERHIILQDRKEMILQKCVCSVRKEAKFLVSNIVHRSVVFLEGGGGVDKMN